MRKTAAAVTVVLVFLAASCLTTGRPVSGADIAENTWTQKAPMHETRWDMLVAAANHRIYAIGGITDEGVVGTNEAYDPTTDSWLFKQPMPNPRQGFTIATFKDKIYCIGGILKNGTVTGLNEVFDPATDTWETKAPMPTVRLSLRANTANNKIYLIGGYIPAFYTTQNFTATPINEAYDPATDTWSTKAPIPVAVNGYVSAVVDEKIYVFGGVENIKGTQIYDAETDTWSQGATSPYSIYFGLAVATEGFNAPVRIYILHQDLSSAPPDGPVNGNAVLHVYDPGKERWSKATIPPTNRSGYGFAILNDLLYAVGGAISGYQKFPDDWIHGPSLIARYANNEQYTPFGYGTIPPKVSIASPQNGNQSSNAVSLNFTVNKPVDWMGYSLDGQQNTTVAGNSTLNMSQGLHNVTVYANDTFGNIGASETISFNVSVPEPEPATFPVAPVVTVSVAMIAAVGAGLLVYFRRRKRQPLATDSKL